jgi:hypothetical protein
MAALPPPLYSRSQSGRAAGIAAVALGALVAIAVAAVFLLLTGAGRIGWPDAREGYRTGANPGQLQAAPAVSPFSPPVASQAIPIRAPHTPKPQPPARGIGASLPLRSPPDPLGRRQSGRGTGRKRERSAPTLPAPTNHHK